MSFGFGMKFQNLLLAKAGYSNIVSSDGTLAPFVTFTRSTTGSRYNSAGLLESVAINGPRFDYDPATVTSSNLLRYSQDFDNAAWAKTDATVIADAIEAPDGTFTADKLVTTIASNPNIQQQLTSVSRTATDMKFSYYVRAGNTSESYAQIFNNGGNGNYAHTATILSGPGSVSGVGTTAITITGLSQTQWTRVQLGVSSNTNTIGTPTFYIKNRVSSSAIGDFTYIWGAQVELGGSSTGYIPTTASPAGNATLRGLLIEEQRTNLILRSEEFDTASWTKTRASITGNSGVSPNGTVSADFLVEDTTASSTHFASQTMTVASGAMAYSIYAKAGTRSRIYLEMSDNTTGNCGATFNLSTGAVTGSGASGSWTGVTSSATLVGNGWYRCVLIGTRGAGTQTVCNAFLDNGTTITYTGDGTSGLFIWGAQLEAAGFATSYIPTAAGSVTRGFDSAIINTLSDIGFNTVEGSIYSEFDVIAVNTTTRTVVYGTSDSGFNRLALRASDSAINYPIGAIGTGASVVSLAGSAITANTFVRIGMAYGSNMGYSQNGATPVTDASVAAVGGTAFSIGSVGGVLPLNGHIRKLAYYPRRLSNAELQQMTT